MEKSQISKSTSPNFSHHHNNNHHINEHHYHQQQIQNKKKSNCDIKTVQQQFQQHQQNNQLQQSLEKNVLKNRDEDKIKNLKESLPDIDNMFDIHHRIGSGTFSTVFLGSLKGSRNPNNNDNQNNRTNAEKRKFFAIKHIIPTSSPQRIVKELKCLVDIGGVDNVIGIRLCLRCNENVAFIMPYIEHEKFQTYFEKMNISEVQLYMKNLLIALRRVHKFQIIHRDVKPSNFLYNRKTKEFLLIDFGLAQNVITRSDREASLLKRKHDDRLLAGDTNSSVGGVSQYNKKRCLDEQQKSPEKMPLKPINGVNSSIATPGMSGTTNSLSPGDQSTNKNSKSESPNNTNNNNTHLEKDTSDLNSSRTTKRNLMFQKSIATEHHKQINNNFNSRSNMLQQQQQQMQQNKCNCYGKAQVCKVCLVRKEIPASRAGTPGYRPPEVLLKYTDQTTAVDIWSAGVIFISILSGVYPFFKAPDDFIALAEIVMLFGDEAIRKTAFSLGRQVTMSRKCKPLNLRRLCVRLRNRNKIDRNELLAKYEKNGKKYEECTNCQQMSYDCLCANTKYQLEDIGNDIFPDSAYDFLSKLLEINPHKRITAAKALQHPFLREKFD